MENFHLDKKVKVFLFLVVTIPFLVLFGIVMGEDIINPKSRGETYLQDKLSIKCRGKVSKIYRQKMKPLKLTIVFFNYLLNGKRNSKLVIPFLKKKAK